MIGILKEREKERGSKRSKEAEELKFEIDQPEFKMTAKNRLRQFKGVEDQEDM